MSERRLRFIEFLVIGVFLGIAEDFLAILFATDAKITPMVFVVVVIIALPFAFFSEMVVDQPRFWENLFARGRRRKDSVFPKT